MSQLPPSVPADSVVDAVGASAGLAIGEALVFSRRRRLRLPNYQLSNMGLVAAEIFRLEKAQAQVRGQLLASRGQLPPELCGQAGIIDAHLLLLDDPLLAGEVRRIIWEEHRNAEQAVVRTIEKITGLMEKVADEYISARLADVEMLAYALIAALTGDEAGRMPDLPAGAILVVTDISPAELTHIAQAKIAGLVTERGGHTSHTAIVAQALELPAVVGAKNLGSRLESGDTVILDGHAGRIILRPNQETLAFYRARQEMEWSFKAETIRSSHLPALTLDGRRIAILGNMELEDELPAVLNYGGEGIGLYRTEFMYLNRQALPTEEELFAAYRRVVETVAPRQVIIRTLDLGNDKIVGARMEAAGRGPDNQALGLRGIRYCLSNRPLFRTQLRAILRASVFGDLKIMLPMISSLDELRQARALIVEAERSLELQGLPYTYDLPLGVMIEVPASIFIARELAGEAAFFSVGTNDLIQYSLAVDRANPEVSDMYQPLHPAILRMLKIILDLGRETGTPVSICGDMASGQLTVCALLGLGAEILSMPPAAIPRVKRLVRMSSWDEMRVWAEDLLSAGTAREAADKAARHLNGRFPEMFR